MKGLIIKEKWLNLIFNGKKTWEIRNNNIKIRGKIGLIQSGTGKVYGECDIIDSITVTKEILLNNKEKHQINDENINNLSYNNPHAWVLSNIKKYSVPISYKHKNGSVIWVDI